MKSSCLLLFVIIFLSFARASSQEGWFWQYPKPQGNNLNDIYIFNNESAIAVGDLGTVIKTTDGGIHWDVQHHAGGTPNDLYSVHFIDSLNGWAAGGIKDSQKNILLKTDDGGKNWTEVKTDASLCYNAVYFVDADTGFVIGEDGILLRTSNGGQSWDTRKIDDYIGEGWLDVFDLTAITFTDKQTGWIIGLGFYGNQIYKTTDCGRTWQWNGNIIQPMVFPGLNDICFTDKNNGFITGAHGTFLKTTDGGNTWQYQNLSTKYQKEEYQYFYSIFFTDSLTGWIVGGDYYAFILKTTDGGENWTEEANNNNEMMHHFYKTRYSNKSSDNTGWIVGQFGMIYRTTDAGGNWVPQRDKNYHFNSIYFVDEYNGWAVGDSGIILHTTNGRDNWDIQNSVESTLLSSVYAIDTQNIFAVGSIIKGLSIYDRTGLIFRTINGGQTWQKQIYDSLYGFNSITFVNDSIGWISGTGSLLKTDDKGITWKIVVLDSVQPDGRVQFINDNVGWIGGTLKTMDGGKNWEPQVIPITSINSFDFINSEMGWVVASSNGNNNILKTTDGGNSWVPCSTTPSGYNFSIQFVTENIGWISGFDFLNRTSLILKSTDGGYTWNEQQSPCKNEGGLSNIFFINESTGWSIGNGIIKTIDGGGVVSIKNDNNISNNLPDKIKLFQNYPNPFNPSTIIKYYLPKSGLVSLRVYDVLGRVINTLVNKFQREGEYEVRWETNNLPSGIYFYQLKTGKYSETKKMILLR